MKLKIVKTAFMVFTTLFALNVNATTPELGKEYAQIKAQPSAAKEVVEFFSFYCPHCYSYEMEYHIPSKIKAELPAGTELKQYHVNFLGRQSENLTRAWGLAIALGLEEKIKPALFEKAQANALTSMDDIRQVFLDNGVTAEQFDGGINSFIVNGLYNKQVQLADEFKIRGVPAFFVNEQYEILAEGLADAGENFIQRYVDTVIFLVNKK